MSEKKTKIIYCITKSDWGGAQKYVYDLATALPRNQYDISVILGTEGVLSKKLETVGLKTIILGNFARDVKIWNDFLAFLKLVKIFRREKPDIIHLNSSKMGGIGVVAGRLARVPKIIFTGHGWAFNEDRSGFQKKLIYMLHSLTVDLADKTIVVSEKTREQMHRQRNPADKTIIIKNGVEEMTFLDKDLAKQKIIERLPTNLELAKRPWLGNISELHKNKGLKYLIEAMHLLKIENDDPTTLPLLIVIGEGERREKLQERIDRYLLQDSVFLIGQLDEAAKYLKAFDAFVLSSITEALPYVILEAGLAERPVISTDVGGVSEIVDDMSSGLLIRPKDPAEIHRAVAFLLNNPDKASLFGQKLHQKVRKDFNRDRMIKETLTLYKEI